MIRFLSWWLFMGITFSNYAQTVNVIDKTSRMPLEWVTLSCEKPSILVVTDEYGKADVSAFKNADTIYIRMLGYKMLTTNYIELQKYNFVAQLTRSEMLLSEVVVSSFKEDTTRETSLHIEPLYLKDIEQKGTFSLTDALSALPGVSQLSTGIGISKPVIRGLFGNRILVLFSGLHFDNQQWQEEHGLGLSDIGISKIEIVKGPFSVLYGTEAMGGIINIIEEQPAIKGTLETDLSTKIHSNTHGGSIQLGMKANNGKKWYGLRLGLTNHCDYSDGNYNRVLNSRFNGYYVKSSIGFAKKKHWQSDNYYHFFYNKFGFIFNDIDHFMNTDKRWSRRMTGPHHIIILNTLSSVNTIELQNSSLKLNVGFQSNFRSEDEGGGVLSLIMHLMTGQYSLKWNKQLGNKLFLVISNNTMLENNTNYGKRKIVPNAWMAETTLSAYLKHKLNKLIFEYGLGAGMRYINTRFTPTVNSAEKDIDPFRQTRPFLNAMLGLTAFPQQVWNIKANLSTGVRSPNLAELSANGLHEGIYTYEIGDPNMKNEQNLNGEIGIFYIGKFLQINISGFCNYFNGYIYLKPTSEEWFGFPVYRFKQEDAVLFGSESLISFTPPVLKGLKVSAEYSELIGKLLRGGYLPYMPAQKIKPEIRYDYYGGKSNLTAFCFVNVDLIMQQRLTSSQEKSTPSYQLVNAGMGVTFTTKKAKYTLNIIANNLLNEAYYDHLSRLKNFGLLNIGQDISIQFKINFIHNLK